MIAAEKTKGSKDQTQQPKAKSKRLEEKTVVSDYKKLLDKKKENHTSTANPYDHVAKEEKNLSDAIIQKESIKKGTANPYQLLAQKQTPKPQHNTARLGSQKTESKAVAKPQIKKNEIAQPSQEEALELDKKETAEITLVEKETVTAPPKPEEDPNFLALTQSIEITAQGQKKHERTSRAISKAQKASPVNTNEQTGEAQANQVEEMAVQEPGEFSAESFKQLLAERLKEIALPETEEKAYDFENNNNISEVNQRAATDVNQAKDTAANDIASTTQAPPNTNDVSLRKAIPLRTPNTGKVPSIEGVKSAMPNKYSETQIEQPVAQNIDNMNQRFDQLGVSEAAIEQSNEPAFIEALAAKKQAQEQSQASMSAYRQEESSHINQSEQEAEQAVSGELKGMHGIKDSMFNQVAGQQKRTANKDSKKRAQVAQAIDQIYNASKTRVNSILDNLERNVATKFKAGTTKATEAFLNEIKVNMEAYKLRRYGKGFNVKQLRRAYDYVFTSQEVTDIFDAGRNTFMESMDACIDDIANMVSQELNAAKEEIAKGKEAVSKHVEGLDPSLKKYGRQAAKDIQSKFDTLESNVDQKQNALIETLAEKYTATVQVIDEKVSILKESNKGLWQKAGDKFNKMVTGVLEMKAKLTKLIGDLLDVIEAIIFHPFVFMENLAVGIGTGIQNFFTNIGTHLQSGFVSWLTGSMGDFSIELPENIFSAKGIFSITTQVLGLTWSRIRQVGTKVVGEPIVSALEKGFEQVTILKEKGLAGLWEHLKEEMNDLFAGLLAQIKEILLVQVLKAGIQWLLSLLNPIGGFIKVVSAIIELVQFFVERAAQLMDLVQTFVDAMSAIAQGKVGKVAAKIESAMAKAVPFLIGMLAAVLNLGAITKKVTDLMQALQQKVEQIIISLWEKMKKAGRKLLRKDKKKKVKTEDDAKNLQVGDGEVGEVVTFDAAKHEHTFWFEESKDGVELMIASVPKTLKQKIADWEDKFEEKEEAAEGITDASEKKKENSRIRKHKGILKKVKDADEKILKKGKEVYLLFEEEEKREKNRKETKNKPDNTAQEAHNKDDKLEEAQRKMIGDIKNLYEYFEDIVYQKDAEELPISRVGWEMKNDMGLKMTAAILTKNTFQGSEPGVTNSNWDKMVERKQTDNARSTSYYVRGHLLNHNIGGTGKDWKNLTPLTQVANKEHSRVVEEPLKKKISGGEVMFYSVKVDYYDGENKIPTFPVNNFADKGRIKIVNDIREGEEAVPEKIITNVKELKDEDEIKTLQKVDPKDATLPNGCKEVVIKNYPNSKHKHPRDLEPEDYFLRNADGKTAHTVYFFDSANDKIAENCPKRTGDKYDIIPDDIGKIKAVLGASYNEKEYKKLKAHFKKKIEEHNDYKGAEKKEERVEMIDKLANIIDRANVHLNKMNENDA